jgi:P2-related tail formation protein
LKSKNNITAVYTLAVPVLVYSFRIDNWKRKETEKIDKKMIKPVTVEGIHHMKADINRLHIKR